MAPKLYGHLISPGTRAVLIFSKIINLGLEYIPLNILKGEHHSDTFTKINPRHCVPTLDDDGHILWDSHAIMIYLAEKYGNDHPLYPLDVEKRSTINKMLFFDCGEIFCMHKLISMPVFVNNAKNLPEDGVKFLTQAYGFLETFLRKTKFVAGNDMTIADLSIWMTLSNSRNLVPLDKETYPNILEWIEEMENLPQNDINEEGVADFIGLLKTVKYFKSVNDEER